MTVQQLIDRLREFPPDMTVKALWDTVSGWDVHRVELFNGTALLDVGNGDGDWSALVDDEVSGRYPPRIGRATPSR